MLKLSSLPRAFVVFAYSVAVKEAPPSMAYDGVCNQATVEVGDRSGSARKVMKRDADRAPVLAIVAYTSMAWSSDVNHELLLSDLEHTLPLAVESFPQLTLNIYASEGVADLSGSEIDVAIRYGAKPPEGSGEIVLYQEYYVAAVSKSLLQPGRAARIEMLTKQRLIEVRWENSALTAPSWKAWFSAAGRDGFETFRRMSFDAYNLAFDALKRGHGAALLSRTIVNSSEFEDSLVQLEGPQLPGYHYRVLQSPSAMRKRAVRQFVDWIAEAAKG